MTDTRRRPHLVGERAVTDDHQRRVAPDLLPRLQQDADPLRGYQAAGVQNQRPIRKLVEGTERVDLVALDGAPEQLWLDSLRGDEHVIVAATDLRDKPADVLAVREHGVRMAVDVPDRGVGEQMGARPRRHPDRCPKDECSSPSLRPGIRRR